MSWGGRERERERAREGREREGERVREGREREGERATKAYRVYMT